MNKRIVIIGVCLLATGCSKNPSKWLGIGTDSPNMKLNTLVMGQSNNAYFSPHFSAKALQPGESEYKKYVDGSYVNCAVGGTYIKEWLPGTPNFEACMSAIGPVDVVLWYQGEADSQSNGDYAIWAQQFSIIAREIKKRKGNAVKIVYAQLAADPDINPDLITNQLGNRWLHWDEVKMQQASVCIDGVKMVTTEDLATVRDRVHLTAESYKILADRYLEAIKRLQAE